MPDPAALPEGSLPLSVELRIDAVCQSFEAAWQAAGNAGPRPRIEAYLDTTTEPERGALLRELLKVELHYRRGERPTRNEYSRRFPAHAASLAPLFGRLSRRDLVERGGQETAGRAGAPTALADAGFARDAGWQVEAEKPSDQAAPSTAAGEAAGLPRESVLTPAGQPEEGVKVPPVAPPPLQPGEEPVPGYRLVRRLGKGGFGEVWEATAPGGFPVAFKFVSLTGPAGEVEQRALQVIRGVRHPNLLSIFGTWQSADRLIIGMELADCTLHDRFQEVVTRSMAGIPRRELLRYAQETARVLDYLNKPRHFLGGTKPVGIQHGDVKPQNILLVGEGVKVGDFGLVRVLERSLTRQPGGLTQGYAAPEVLQGQVSRWSDQYALAATYCQLRGGRLPFSGQPRSQPPDLGMVPEEERPALARALAADPRQRWPSCRALVRALAEARQTAEREEGTPTPVPVPPDNWLVQLKAGDPGAAQALWERYFPRMVALARKQLQGARRREGDEEDVALDAFDSLCQGAMQGRFPQLSDYDDLWRLLVVITARKALDLLEKQGRIKRGGRLPGESALLDPAEPEGGGVERIVGDEPTPEFAAEVSEECQRLLDQLGDDELRKIAVWKMEGDTNEQIAERLGLPLASVEHRLRLIRERREGEAASSSAPEAIAPTGSRPPAAAGPAPDPVARPSMPGYEVLREVARGGMGVVYQARQKILNRPVALKVVLARAHAGAWERHRFRAEAEALARLQHPNIVQIYEVGEHDGSLYIVLEYLDGKSLAQELTGTPLPVAEAVGLVEALARAIHHAHEHGILHGHLNPANVLLTHGGVPKVTGFGLAPQPGADISREGPSAVLGTPPYMAPEQARAEAIGPAADVYALGAILYGCLTGRPPFQGTSTLDTLEQVVSAELVSPVRLNAQVPRDLETVCLKCLHKEPHRRYASAEELAADLHRYQAGEPITARGVGLWACSFRWVTHLASRAWRATQRARWREHRPAVPADSTTLAQEMESWASVAPSPAAGRQPAASPPTVLQRQDGGGGPRVFEGHTDAVWGVAFAPDGRRALSGSIDGTVRLWDVETGDQLRRFEGHTDGVTSIAFAPDGRACLSAGLDGTVRLWDVETGQERRRLERHAGRVFSVVVSPDGSVALSAGEDCTVRLWDVTTAREVCRWEGHTGWVTGVAFAADGRRAVSGGEDGTVCFWDVESGRELGRGAGHTGAVRSVAFAADGRRAVSGGEDGTVRLWDAESGRELACCAGHTDWVRGVACSPAGDLVLSGSDDETLRLWRATTGRELRCFEVPRASVLSVAFSPDGRWALSGDDSHAVRLWELAAESGRRQPRQ